MAAYKADMKTNLLLLPVIAAIAIAAPRTTAKANLGELLTEGDLEWILGDWVDADSGGDNLQLKYAWKFKGQVIGVSFKSADGSKSEGMIVRKPGTEEVLHYAATNKGGISVGTWEESEGTAILTVKHTKEDGESVDLRIAHSKVDDKTMKVAFLDESGSEQGGINLVRRQKKKASESVSDAKKE